MFLNCGVGEDSWEFHGLQHPSPLCPSPTPRVYPNSCPLSRWCHPTISSFVVPFSSCFQTVVLEKTLESPLDSKEINLVNRKGYQPWILVGRTDAKAEAPVLWPPDTKSQFTGKTPDSGKDWGQEEKGMTKDKMVGWHHWFNRWVWANSGR